MMHYVNIRVPATELRIDNNKTDSPVRHDTKRNKKEYSCEESCLPDSVG
jgi:hypothetical protein